MPNNNLEEPNIIEESITTSNNKARRDFINIVPEMSDELKNAINYLNAHRFDNYDAVDYGDEEDTSIFDYSDDIADTSDSSAVNSTIIEDDDTTESFDDIGLF